MACCQCRGYLEPKGSTRSRAALAVAECHREPHTLMMFTHDEYLAAFAQAKLAVEYDSKGLDGRGLYIGTKALA